MAEDPRPEFDPRWPVCERCRGVRVDPHPTCVAHLANLPEFAPGDELDLRGVEVGSALLAAILGKYRDHAKKRFVFGRVRCDHTWFSGKAWFDKALFTSTATFDNAHFSGPARFDGATAEGKMSFVEARFAGRTLMNEVSTPVLDLERAWFANAVEIEAEGDPLNCVNTRFDGGVVLSWAVEVDAHGAYFGAPSMFIDTEVTSLAGSDVSNLVLIDVDLTECKFVGTHRLEQLRIEGNAQFDQPGRWRARRRMLADEQLEDPARVAGLYRSLRKSFEDSKNEAGAGDFYYGEMEARRHSEESSLAERAILSVYWLISGYGQRAWRSLAALVAVIAVVTTVLVNTGQDFGLAARIALGTALSKDPAADLTATGEWTVLVARFLGPVLLALALLAIRARVKR